MIVMGTSGMKVYRKYLRLKVVDAIDRGMVRQGVAHAREALGETIPDALSHQSSWRTKRDGFHTTVTNHRIHTHGDRCKGVISRRWADPRRSGVATGQLTILRSRERILNRAAAIHSAATPSI